MRIIINGAGIAGPTLAYWLRKANHDVLQVEAASRLRTSFEMFTTVCDALLIASAAMMSHSNGG